MINQCNSSAVTWHLLLPGLVLMTGTCTTFVFPGLATVEFWFFVSLDIFFCIENNADRRLLFYLQQYKNLSSLMIVVELLRIREQQFLFIVHNFTLFFHIYYPVAIESELKRN